MKTILGIAFGFFALTFALSTDSFAQGKHWPRSVNDRQQNQRQRIGQGVKSGELTARETARLAREQVQIQRMENRFRTSGDGLNARERVRLQHELNQSSRHIYRQKHDQQGYPSRP
jgi:phage terminase Nu1 subunit (DNA packaging protein)